MREAFRKIRSGLPLEPASQVSLVFRPRGYRVNIPSYGDVYGDMETILQHIFAAKSKKE